MITITSKDNGKYLIFVDTNEGEDNYKIFLAINKEDALKFLDEYLTTLDIPFHSE